MVKIKVSTKVGFIIECVCILITIVFAVSFMKGNLQSFFSAVFFGVLSAANYKQISGFLDKPTRLYSDRFEYAMQLLSNPNASNMDIKCAMAIVEEAANGNYLPAIKFLHKVKR